MNFNQFIGAAMICSYTIATAGLPAKSQTNTFTHDGLNSTTVTVIEKDRQSITVDAFIDDKRYNMQWTQVVKCSDSKLVSTQVTHANPNAQTYLRRVSGFERASAATICAFMVPS